MHKQNDRLEITTRASNLVFYLVEKVDGLYHVYTTDNSEPLTFFKQSELEEWKEKHDNVYTVIIETVWAEHDER